MTNPPHCNRYYIILDTIIYTSYLRRFRPRWIFVLRYCIQPRENRENKITETHYIILQHIYFFFVDDMERQRAESTFTILSKVKNSPNVNMVVKWLKSNKLLISILVSVVLGVILGECKFIYNGQLDI